MKYIMHGMFLSVILKYKNLSVKLRDVYDIMKFYICAQIFYICVLKVFMNISHWTSAGF